MRKTELRKLRSLPATDAIIREGKLKKKVSSSYSAYNREYEIPVHNVLARAQNLSSYIKVALFVPKDIQAGIKTPRYEVFLNAEGHEWITRELDREGKEVRWLTSKIINLPDISIYIYTYGREEERQTEYLTQDTERTLRRLDTEDVDGKKLDKSYKGLKRLYKWQQSVREAAILEAEKREVAPWDKDMKLVPALPKSFSEWVLKDVCKDIYMFYKFDKNGAKEGYCSRCRHDVPISKPKYNEPVICPHCHCTAIFKSIDKAEYLRTDPRTAQLIQKIKGGIVIRTVTVDACYNVHKRNYQNPRIRAIEFKRTLIFDNGEIRHYEYEMYKNKYQRWCLDRSRTGYGGFYREHPLYRRNIKEIWKSKVFEHSAIGLWDQIPKGVTRYLEIEKGNPAVEMLARIGMFRLAKELIDASYNGNEKLLDQEQTELPKILKIDAARLKRMRELDGGISMLKWMQLEKKVNTIWPEEMIKRLGSLEGFTPDNLFFLYNSRYKYGYESRAPFTADTVPYQKIYNYLLRQTENTQQSLHDTVNTYRDYMYMAFDAKKDLKLETVWKPKDLKAAHDELVLITNKKSIKTQADNLRKQFHEAEKHMEKLKKFEMKNDKYCIVAPRTIEDIVTEGMILGHCVHTCDYYFNRITTDESYLFFLRKAKYPDMPWYTLEVESSGNIRQKRTTGDNQNKDLDEAIPFLQEWQQYFVTQLTGAEKEQGAKADMLRRENYKNLRKNQNKVWHGKLAGQLLADVLEADLMEVIGI